MVAPLPAPGQGLTVAVQKVIKAKINTNLRTQSAASKSRGRTKSPAQRAKEVKSKVQLGLSPEERLNEELEKRMGDQI